ncbi:MAG: ribosome small subunit-dependent GTPase A [Clostridia bacterium]|nr:ribosome small subunit-dependent GTPase A [Clostridia bacterium]
MLLKGTIIKGIGGFYYVDTNEGIIECRARGKFRKNEILPMVGDKVEIEVSATSSGSVKKIEERANFLIRPAVSNIDKLMIVAAITNPAPDTSLIDKMLIIAAKKGIKGSLCINKSDLDTSNEAEKLKDCYEKAGYRVFVTSAEKGIGLEELRHELSGKITAFAGLSGVGKSSILTLITGKELETGDTSRIERGKHTTRHVELIKTDDGYVFDTPGFSQLEVEDIKASELWEYFPEMAECNGLCRFRGCSHVSEPDCAVKSALEKGDIPQSRYESYVKMYEKLKLIKDWERGNTNGTR